MKLTFNRMVWVGALGSVVLAALIGFGAQRMLSLLSTQSSALAPCASCDSRHQRLAKGPILPPETAP
jgi:Na+-driven multidrug efflux pump